MKEKQETVETNPEEYIVKECIPACKELWEKNIYTYSTSDMWSNGVTFISLREDALSDRNKEILKMLEGKNIFCYVNYQGGYQNDYRGNVITFGVEATGEKGQEKLLRLAELLEMQDVMEGEAYISCDDFLMDYCGCYDEVSISEDEKKNEMDFNFDKPTIEEWKEYEDWLNSRVSPKPSRVLNKSKMTKSIEELAKEKGMVVDGDRVYLSQFHYEKHCRYLEYIKSQSALSPESMAEVSEKIDEFSEQFKKDLASKIYDIDRS